MLRIQMLLSVISYERKNTLKKMFPLLKKNGLNTLGFKSILFDTP